MNLLVCLAKGAVLCFHPTSLLLCVTIAGLGPQAKIVAVLSAASMVWAITNASARRNGESVIASWGKRPYGFNKPVNWGQFRRSKFSEQEAIGIFLRKWADVIIALEEYRKRANILIVDYDRLLASSEATLRAIYRFCDLELSAEVAKARFTNNGPRWQEVVSPGFHGPLQEGCQSGNDWIRENAIRV